MERRTIGNVHVTALIDNTQAYPATAVYPDAGKALDQFSNYLDDSGGLPLSFAAYLINDGGKLILVDTGWGPEANGHLPTELSAAGVSPEEIGTVAFTHLHGDHTGWNIDRESGLPLFPNARYMVPEGDWAHYNNQDPEPDSFLRDVRPLRETGHLELIKEEARLSESVVAVATPGHTPGHTSYSIRSGGDEGFILGDVVIGMPDAELPSLRNSFDHDPGAALTTRTVSIARFARDRVLVAANHLPAPGFGRFSVIEGKSYWEPV